jgi:hypothetical protein
MLVFLVGAYRVKRLDAEHTDDAAEDIRLLKVQLDQFGSLLLNELNRLADVKGI